MKIHKMRAETMVAVCDEELLGKTLTEGDLKVHISNGFYGGMRVSEQVVRETLRLATIGNLFGTRSVQLAIETGMIEGSNVILIAGVPHAQFVRA